MRQWREACTGRASSGCKPSSITLPMTLDVFITFYASALSPDIGQGYVSTSKTLSCAIRFHEVLLQRDLKIAKLHRVKLSLILQFFLGLSWSVFIT